MRWGSSTTRATGRTPERTLISGGTPARLTPHVRSSATPVRPHAIIEQATPRARAVALKRWGVVPAIALVAAGAWFARSDIAATVASDPAAITQVSAIGQRLTPDQDIFDAVAAANGDLAGARRAIEALPWVAAAAVTRVSAAEVRVTLIERRPAYVWSDGAQEKYLDVEGRDLGVAPASRDDMLLLVRGAEARAALVDLDGLLSADPLLRRETIIAERIGARRWTLTLRDGTHLHLPAENAVGALARWHALPRSLKVEPGAAIDLRFANATIVRAPDDEPQDLAAAEARE